MIKNTVLPSSFSYFMIVFNENILNTSRYKNILHNLKGQGQLKSMFANFFFFSILLANYSMHVDKAKFNIN